LSSHISVVRTPSLSFGPRDWFPRPELRSSTFLDPTLGLMDCILRSKSCLSDTHTPSDPYPTLSLPKGSLYLSMSTLEPLSGTPDHYSCLGLCPLQYLHPMPSLRIDTCIYPTSYQVDGTPSEFPALIRTVPTLIRKSFGCSTRVVCLWSPLDFVRTLLDFIQN